MVSHTGSTGRSFRFRVSDAVEVPHRGVLLRLRLMEGSPSVGDFRPGRYLRLRAPDGAERWVRVLDYAIVGGRATQARLERTRELDVVISSADARRDGRPVEIGWQVVDAAPSAGERAA
ncbi:MAG TPA: hypothetical protein VF212_03165 [Longimicrobiales bacterium]